MQSQDIYPHSSPGNYTWNPCRGALKDPSPALFAFAFLAFFLLSVAFFYANKSNTCRKIALVVGLGYSALCGISAEGISRNNVERWMPLSVSVALLSCRIFEGMLRRLQHSTVSSYTKAVGWPTRHRNKSLWQPEEKNPQVWKQECIDRNYKERIDENTIMLECSEEADGSAIPL